jgi:hypothetical protein
LEKNQAKRQVFIILYKSLSLNNDNSNLAHKNWSDHLKIKMPISNRA